MQIPLKKWWFWLIIILALIFVAGIFSSEPQKINKEQEEITPTQTLEPILTPAATPKTQEQTKAPATQNLFLVTRVIDGDTIEIEGGQKIRYIGIDTPETVDPRKPVQCFGVEASNKNKELVSNKKVRLEKDVSDIDRYGRLLRYVYVDDLFVNLELVKEGFAYSSTFPPDVKYQNQFIEAQQLAREQGKGLWGSCPVNGTAPASTASPTPTPISGQPVCDIKGNISKTTGEKIYHISGCASYNKTVINEAEGEMWFCTESEALNAGWRKALNCP